MYSRCKIGIEIVIFVGSNKNKLGLNGGKLKLSWQFKRKILAKPGV